MNRETLEKTVKKLSEELQCNVTAEALEKWFCVFVDVGNARNNKLRFRYTWDTGAEEIVRDVQRTVGNLPKHVLVTTEELLQSCTMDRCYLKLVPVDACEPGVVCESFLDLMAVAYFDAGDVNITVAMDGVQKAGFGIEQAIEAARRNTMGLEAEWYRLSDVLRTYGIVAESPMWYIKSKDITYGANCLYSKRGLRELAAELCSDLVILPCSRYDVLAIPYSESLDPEELKEIVREVNTVALTPLEFLSDSVYLYCREEDEVCVWR